MRTPFFLLPLLVLSACGSDPATVTGNLAEGTDASHVWVLGRPERATVAADSFVLDGLAEGDLDLRFAAGEKEVARMEIRGVGPGRQLFLRDVWFDDGIAHPSAVELSGAGPVTVNGLRLGGAAMSGSVDAASTVLVVSRAGDALIVRPVDEQMPDLRVVITPGTRVRTPDGDPAAADQLEFGDSVQVVGQAEAGYVIASELVLPRDRAGGASRRSDADREQEAQPRVRAASTVAAAAAARAPLAHPAGKEKPKKAAQGKGKGKNKKKG